MRPPLLLMLALLLPGAVSAQALQVEAEPASVVLGRDTSVTVRVSRAGGAPLRLEAAASSGTLSAPTSSSGGAALRFTYTPPEARHPHWATLLFWEPGKAQPQPTVLRLPLLGRTTLDIATEPDAQVVVQVQRTRFGPVRANGQGQARVPVEVPPDVRSARVLATAHGEQTEREVPLDVPPDGALATLLGPLPVPASGESWLAVAAEDALTPEALQVEVEGGEARPVAGSRPPLFRVIPHEGSTRLSLQVRRRGEAKAVSLQAEVLAAPAPAAAPTPEPGAPSPWAVHALGGAFVAGGANAGPALALGAGYTLPPLGGRLVAEAELGLRSASLEGPLTGSPDSARSELLGVPLLLSLRVRLLERGALSLGARLGGGVTLLRHRFEVEGQPAFTEHGTSPVGFAALQGAWALGPLAVLLETRGSLQPASTAHLHARLGGLGLLLGVRYAP